MDMLKVHSEEDCNALPKTKWNIRQPEGETCWLFKDPETLRWPGNITPAISWIQQCSVLDSALDCSWRGKGRGSVHWWVGSHHRARAGVHKGAIMLFPSLILSLCLQQSGWGVGCNVYCMYCLFSVVQEGHRLGRGKVSFSLNRLHSRCVYRPSLTSVLFRGIMIHTLQSASRLVSDP